MNNNQLPTLTKEKRDKILSGMNERQIHALTRFEMYEMKSRFHTRNFLKGTRWEFEGVEIDPWYNRSKKHKGQNLYCDCGRRVKRRYILQSRKKRVTKKLGITHFEQEAGVPVRVIREIQQGINKIDIYRDMILLDYFRGNRFPAELFQKAVVNGAFHNNQHHTLYQKCMMFKRANLPLFINDMYRLKKVVAEAENNQPAANKKAAKAARASKAEYNRVIAEYKKVTDAAYQKAAKNKAKEERREAKPAVLKPASASLMNTKVEDIIAEKSRNSPSKNAPGAGKIISSISKSTEQQDRIKYQELVKYLKSNRDLFADMPGFDYVFRRKIAKILRKHGVESSYSFKIAILLKLLTPAAKCQTLPDWREKFNQFENGINFSYKSYKADQRLLPNAVYEDLLVRTLDFNISDHRQGYSSFYRCLPLIQKYLQDNLRSIDKKDYQKIAILWLINYIGNLNDDLVQPENLGSIKLVLLHTFPDLNVPAFPMKLQTKIYKVGKRIRFNATRSLHKSAVKQPAAEKVSNNQKNLTATPVEQPKDENVAVAKKAPAVSHFEAEAVASVYTNVFKFFLEQNPYFKMPSTGRIKRIIVKILNDNHLVPANLLAIKVLTNLMLSWEVTDKYLYLKNILHQSEQSVLFDLYRGALSEKAIPDHVYCEVIQWMVDHFNKRIRHCGNYDFSIYANVINNYYEQYCRYDEDDCEKISLRWTIDFLKVSVNDEDEFNHLLAIESVFKNVFPDFEYDEIPDEVKVPLSTAEYQALCKTANGDE